MEVSHFCITRKMHFCAFLCHILVEHSDLGHINRKIEYLFDQPYRGDSYLLIRLFFCRGTIS